jgi:hypothetical protein
MDNNDTPSVRSRLAAVTAFHATAYALASSGRYRNATTIAIALERQGVDCALQFVGADLLLETQLNEVCRQHYAGPAGNTPSQSWTSQGSGLASACPLAESDCCSSMACPVATRADDDLIEVTDRAPER